MDTLKREELKSKKTIDHCCRSLLVLEFASLCPLDKVLPNISFSCDIFIEIWRIEVVEAKVEDLVSPVHRRADRGCHLCNL